VIKKSSTDPRSVRGIDDATWKAVGERAEREHRTRSDVVRVALRAYAAGRYDAVEPVRRKP